MQRQQTSRTSSSDESNDSSLSRVLIHSAEQTTEHTLPLSITPSSSSTLTATTRRTTQTQTIQDSQSSFSTKSIPSFAETQLLSVYYPSKNPPNPSVNDKCIFVEQQDRQPVRYRSTYDPLSSTKSTQTPPSSTPLSTYGSTLIINTNQPMKSDYQQYVKIHSGSQNLSNNIPDEHSSPNELIEQSRHSYEEYIVNLETKQNRTSSSSSSSVTTVIAQNEELDSDHTSHLSFEPINTQSSTSSTSTNHEKQVINNNQRISSWPPMPDGILPIDNQYENDEQKHLSRVQFAEQLIHVIPPSITNSLSEDSVTPPPVIPRSEKTGVDPRLVQDQLQRLDYHPINQSKWIKTHLNNSEIQTTTISSRVDTLRSIFEQQNSRSSDSSTLNSPTNQIRRIEPEEKSSKHGDEIRFRIKDKNSSSIHYAEPAKIIQHSTNSSIITKQDEHSITSFKLDQIRQITGKQFKSLDDVGRYLQDGHTWQWNEIFWLSLTTSQRDQLKDLEHKLYSRQHSTDHSLHQNDSELSSSASNETKRFTSTVNVTGAGAWQQQHKPRTLSSGIIKYTETSTIHENQPSVNVFGSAPNPTSLRIGSQESINQQQILTSNKRTDSQITIIESGYNSADDQQRFRPNSSTIIEESSPHHIDSNSTQKLDPLSYKQFIYDYLSTYARHSRSDDGTLILSFTGQHLPSSNNNLTLTKSLYSDAIDENPLPFETESDELVIFIHGEVITIPADQWLFYREKYSNAPWIRQLKRVNRDIPHQLIPIIEQWLADHATLSFDTHELNVDGLPIPLIGGLDLHQIQQLQPNYWNEILTYLIRIGYVSYDSDQRLIYLANSELDVRRLLPPQSPELIERLAKLLRSLNYIHFHDENGTLIITDNFIISNEYIQNLFVKHQQGEDISANELANLLLQICHVDEDETDQSLILTFKNQTLRLKHSDEDHIKILSQWLHQLNQQNLITITEQNDIIIYPNNPNQQIFINHQHVDTYMKTEMVNMNDIAHILLLYNYVQYSSGQLMFGNQQIILDTNELVWLQSIIRPIRSNKHTRETEIELFDGQQTQTIQIPFEHMPPTDNPRIIANYLFQNGNIRYEVKTGNYAYRYIPPNEPKHSVEHDSLSSHIHIVEDNQRNELEFINDSNDSYSLKSSSEQKENLINDYVEFINNRDGINYDNINHLLILENPLDGSKLYLTREHTQFIHKNQYRRQDMKYLLMKYSRLKQDEFGNWLLYYNNQCIQIPLVDKTDEQVSINLSQATSNEVLDRYHATIDYMFNHGLITCNKRLKLLRIHFSNQTLTIPIDQLRSIINFKIFHSPNDNILPFNSLQLSQWLLNNTSQINNSPQGYIKLTYKNKLYILPLIPSNNQYQEKQEKIDPNLKLLFPFNTSLRLIQKTSSTTTLDIQQPSEANNYAIDPLLILANYIYRVGTIYQDELGRLVIKLNHDEIVIPRMDAVNAIEAINASPNRTGTIIARLINRIGKVQSTKSGGLVITIGKSAFELSKEEIDLTLQNQSFKIINHQSNIPPNLPLLQHSKSVDSLSSSPIGHAEFTDDQQMLYTKDRYFNSPSRNERPSTQTSLRFIIIPDNDTISSSNRPTRFYVQETNSASRDSVQPQLINPQQYQDIALREASVYIRRQGEEEIYYENLAQYLSTKQSYLSSRTVRRMLAFSSRDEYFAYLIKKMSVVKAEQLVQQSEDSSSSRYISRKPELSNEERSKSPTSYYNVQNGTTISQSNLYDQEQQEDIRYKFSVRSPSSSSLGRSPQTTNSTGGHSLTTPDKNVTLPRNTNLSGQSNDGESASRTAVSRSASSAAKVVTSKLDTMKSTTSSSAGSSREHSAVSSPVVRAQSLASPNRTSGSKVGEESTKKEKKSKFRTPSFLRKRKEKKEAANKDKAEK